LTNITLDKFLAKPTTRKLTAKRSWLLSLDLKQPIKVPNELLELPTGERTLRSAAFSLKKQGKGEWSIRYVDGELYTCKMK